MPMVAGIMKKVRNSGEIADWNAHAVYENDELDYLLGDDQRIYHKPTMGDPGQVVGAYSIVKLKEDRKSTRRNSSHYCASRMPSSARTQKERHRSCLLLSNFFSLY